MSNYSKTTDFAAKDSLPSGDSGKIIRGSEFETEFDNISTAIATKADAADPTFTGTVTIDGLTVNGNTTLGNAATDTVTVTADIASNLIPSADDTYNLGASGAEWNDLFIDGTANIDSLVADTADINGGTIDGVTIGGSSAGAGTFTSITTTGNVNFGDNDKAIFGASSDLQIYHSGSHSVIEDSGTGNLFIKGTNLSLRDADGNDYITMVDGGSGGTVSLLHLGSTKLATTSTGIDVTGVITTDGMTTSADINFGDNDKAVFGAGSDLEIFSQGTDALIRNGNATAEMRIESDDRIVISDRGFNEAFAVFNDDSDVKLYHDGSQKLATTSTGVDVTGTVIASSGVDITNGSSSFNRTHSTTTASLQVLNLKATSSGDMADGFGPSIVFAASDTGTTSNQIAEINVVRAGSDTAFDMQFQTADATRLNVGSNGDISFYEDTGTTAKLFWDSSAERLGIGDSSPSKTLTVVDTSSGNTTTPAMFQNSGGVGSAVELRLAPTPYPNDIGSTARWSAIRAINSDVGNATDLAFLTNDISADPTERMRIDHDGNVGIGVVPETDWHSNYAALQLNTGGALSSYASGTVFGTALSTNQRTTGDTFVGGNKYIASKAAQLYLQDNSGNHIWYNAASGTADATISWNERMRISSSGNLLVRCTDLPTGSASGFGFTADQFYTATTSTSANTQVRFYNGNGLVGSIVTDGSATAYNTSSDQRLKDNIVDAPSASDDIDAIQVRSFDWKADGSHQKYGMVAQELQSVAPEAVTGDADSEDMMGVDYSKLVPMMLKEIQSLRARVAQLEGEN